MNKYASLFNENMTEIEASNILFENAKKLSKKEREELLKAWEENDWKICKRIDKENGFRVLTNSNV